MNGWHFTGTDQRLANGDGRVVAAGETLTMSAPPVLCSRGLHASESILDALRYAPGPYVWRVRLGGEVVRGDDKAAATERTAIWGFDATDVLRRFARLCALDVIHLWDAPEVVVRYLRTGDEAIRVEAGVAAYAASAAAAAASAAAYAASVAAHAAASADAGDATAASAAAASYAAAAYATSVAAARLEARARQRRRLTAMVCAEAMRLGVTP